tara:strand:- start:282 stop:980 length:699 start_codon:yes stop_codon:yes gene_type:complete
MREGVWIALLLSVSTGCSFFPVDLKDLSRDPPVKQRYLFDVPAAAAATDAASIRADATGAPLPVLLLEQARAASPFNGRPFIYRTNAAEHAADYYHEFLASPAEQITQITRRWLRSTQQFAHVIESDSPLLANQSLAMELTDLRGDYRDAAQPRAIVGVRVVLTSIADTGPTPEILLEKDYRAEIDMPEAKPSHLVAAWGAGIHQVLTELSSDLLERSASRSNGASQQGDAK